MNPASFFFLATLLAGPSPSATAAEPTTAAPPSRGTADADSAAVAPWIRRLAPERNTGELGVYGGVLLPSRQIELFEADFGLPDQGYRPLARVLPDLGVRLGYYPLRVFGVEVEGGVMPGRTEAGDSVLLWTGRGSLVGQLGLWSVTPFVLVGGGLLGVSSDRAALGDDVDAVFHVGGGLKFHVSRLVQLRLDARDIIAARRGYDAGIVHNVELLLGLSVTLGRSREGAPASAPEDDADGDEILDPDDRCPDTPGHPDFGGCPVPDSDGDEILDPDDRCPDAPGHPDYGGCPIPDSDGDGVLDPDDRCVETPESLNGFEDADGCPDEVPAEVARFTGVIRGIVFETGKATIRSKSAPTLMRAVEVLDKYPSLRVEISGHTDARGSRAHNEQLSQRRADAVKQYLVDKGIDGARVTTRGVGPDEPIADNKTKKGRSKNRRIEFELLTSTAP